jgi:hypothetical protein
VGGVYLVEIIESGEQFAVKIYDADQLTKKTIDSKRRLAIASARKSSPITALPNGAWQSAVRHFADHLNRQCRVEVTQGILF